MLASLEQLDVTDLARLDDVFGKVMHGIARECVPNACDDTFLAGQIGKLACLLAVAAVDFVAHEGLLMAPAYAVSEMLRDAGLGLGDFDFYEIHEAFAAQVLATLKAWESPEFCKQRLGRRHERKWR